METHRLLAHPATPPLGVTNVEARIGLADANWLRLRWLVEGAARLVLPPFAGRGRADGLWQHSCFELFLSLPGAESYVEFNFSPSEQWAAYQFSACREGMQPLAFPRAPVITPRRGGKVLILDVDLPLAGLPSLSWDIGLTAVFEEEGGHLSYWAAHHPADRPDFHHADGRRFRFPSTHDHGLDHRNMPADA